MIVSVLLLLYNNYYAYYVHVIYLHYHKYNRKIQVYERVLYMYIHTHTYIYTYAPTDSHVAYANNKYTFNTQAYIYVIPYFMWIICGKHKITFTVHLYNVIRMYIRTYVHICKWAEHNLV